MYSYIEQISNSRNLFIRPNNVYLYPNLKSKNVYNHFFDPTMIEINNEELLISKFHVRKIIHKEQRDDCTSVYWTRLDIELSLDCQQQVKLNGCNLRNDARLH